MTIYNIYKESQRSRCSQDGLEKQGRCLATKNDTKPWKLNTVVLIQRQTKRSEEQDKKPGVGSHIYRNGSALEVAL